MSNHCMHLAQCRFLSAGSETSKPAEANQCLCGLSRCEWYWMPAPFAGAQPPVISSSFCNAASMSATVKLQ